MRRRCLIDSEFGLGAFAERAPSCGLLTTYEMDGYENPRPHRMLALMPELSVRRMRDMGSDGVKILLSYTPFDDADWNDHKLAMIERIGAECAALDMPFFLEPVGYDVDGLDVKGLEYAKRKPEIVLRTMEELSKDVYQVDILKVEFPVNSAYLGEAYSREEALDWYRRVDAAARRPYIYLSAGVSAAQFREQLDSGERVRRKIFGRTVWSRDLAGWRSRLCKAGAQRTGRVAEGRWRCEHPGGQRLSPVRDTLAKPASLRITPRAR